MIVLFRVLVHSFFIYADAFSKDLAIDGYQRLMPFDREDCDTSEGCCLKISLPVFDSITLMETPDGTTTNPPVESYAATAVDPITSKTYGFGINIGFEKYTVTLATRCTFKCRDIRLHLERRVDPRTLPIEFSLTCTGSQVVATYLEPGRLFVAHKSALHGNRSMARKCLCLEIADDMRHRIYRTQLERQYRLDAKAGKVECIDATPVTPSTSIKTSEIVLDEEWIMDVTVPAQPIDWLDEFAVNEAFTALPYQAEENPVASKSIDVVDLTSAYREHQEGPDSHGNHVIPGHSYRVCATAEVTTAATLTLNFRPAKLISRKRREREPAAH